MPDLRPLRQKLAWLRWLDPFTYVDIYVVPALNPHNKAWLNTAIYLFFAFFFAFLLYHGLGLALGTDTPMVIVVSGSMEPTYARGDVIVLQSVDAGQLRLPRVRLQRPTLRATPLYAYAVPLCASRHGREEACRSLLAAGRPLTGFNTVAVAFENGQRIDLNQDGDIVVYFARSRGQPIIHRAQALVYAGDGAYVLTKGDSPQNPLLDQDPHWDLAPYAVPVQELKGRAVLRIPFIGNLKLWAFDDLPAFLGGVLLGR